MELYTTPDYSVRLDLARRLADRARELTLPLFANPGAAQNKGTVSDYDPVTQADMDAERMMRDMIRTDLPDDTIIGEEFDDHIGSGTWSWTLDPIDGTRAFLAGVPVWSTLIAVSYNDTPVIGLIDHPALAQRFVGHGGKAYREDGSGTAQIRARPCKDIRDIVLGCTEPLAMFSAGERASYEMIRRTARFSRLGLDAYGYAMLASGRMDMILEALLKPCDVRALIPIVEGAGGIITGWHGESPIHGGRVVAAGDPDILEQVYPYLRRAMDS
ncbi:inositol monophosphatase family protein [Robiginitomaculum antarcticum]|uniref:inositol monophosphatase family protein n=1 Tax=Robiginitomaculum antarcticum TaxID=437507 RepID=UPI000381E54D|nr:inositol monophosphatase family protein [Robiginitomaculum antarcticum]